MSAGPWAALSASSLDSDSGWERGLVGPGARGQLGATDAAQRGGDGWWRLPREAGGCQLPASPAVRLAHLESLSPYHH